MGACSIGNSSRIKLRGYLAVFDHQPDRLQVITDTGAGNAVAGIDFKQGVMRRALDKHVVHVEKLVLLPVQIDAGVRAAVYIGSKAPVLVYHEQWDFLASVFDLKRF